MELLEFLGSWELEDGESVDPFEIEALPELDDAALEGHDIPRSMTLEEYDPLTGSRQQSIPAEEKEREGSPDAQHSH